MYADSLGMNAFPIIDSARDGKTWTVRLVQSGDQYGLNDCLTHNEVEALVELYDADQSSTNGRGQFVSRYYLSTFMEIEAGRGLNAHGGVPVWQLSGSAIDSIKARLATNAVAA